ncbi:hypothetical protein [Dolosigranulum pigrum]|uniref:hypothetical protein n=1 Tax=Dolosigranulum pigrum TaxID=29394 RepID=UPI0015EB40AC|nr:hypothetical protein [Dolosigranulum pigrum]
MKCPVRDYGCIYNDHPKEYNGLEDAKEALESDLRRYVKEQQAFDSNYIEKFISVNASRNFDTGKVNELVADVKVLDENQIQYYLIK